jgi:hypothetical protein
MYRYCRNAGTPEKRLVQFRFKFRALQKICLYFYDVECTGTVEMLEYRK